jgi:hypothetical protein
MDKTNDQHVYHHNDSDGLRINMSIERNSRGINYSVTIVGAKSVVEGMTALKEAETSLKSEYGVQAVKEG